MIKIILRTVTLFLPLALSICALGVPLPGTLFLMGTGALALGEAPDLPAIAILGPGRDGNRRQRQLLYGEREDVAYITLNRPEAANALSKQLSAEIVAALEEIRRSTEVHVASSWT